VETEGGNEATTKDPSSANASDNSSSFTLMNEIGRRDGESSSDSGDDAASLSGGSEDSCHGWSPECSTSTLYRLLAARERVGEFRLGWVPRGFPWPEAASLCKSVKARCTLYFVYLSILMRMYRRKGWRVVRRASTVVKEASRCPSRCRRGDLKQE
jgi:hypothetical protein